MDWGGTAFCLGFVLGLFCLLAGGRELGLGFVRETFFWGLGIAFGWDDCWTPLKRCGGLRCLFERRNPGKYAILFCVLLRGRKSWWSLPASLK